MRRWAIAAVACLSLVVFASWGNADAATTPKDLATAKQDKVIARVLDDKGRTATRQTVSPSSLIYGSGVDVSTLHNYLAVVIVDVATYWQTQFRIAKKPFAPVTYLILDADQTSQSLCQDPNGNYQVSGDPDLVANTNPANYCPADNTIRVSTQWIYDHIWALHLDQQRRGGDFGAAAAMAHEMGHMIQKQLAVQLPNTAVTVKPLELQADCLAGVWANSKYYQGSLEPGDVEVAVESFESVGDYEYTNVQHHGTPAERHRAFLTGYNSGRGGVCTLDLGDQDGS